MKTFYNFSAGANTDTAVLTIFDEIGFWGQTAKDFYNKLQAIKAKTIEVHINSPGGNVVDGYAIYNFLRAHSADIHVVIDGMAASIASVIAMAGDKICMPENALMFIHQPWVGGASGNADELRKLADDLDKINKGILAIYVARTGQDEVTINRLMKDETLITAKDAKEMRFCDEVMPEMKAAARYKIENHFDAERAMVIARALEFPSATPAGGREQQPKDKMTPEEKVAHDAALKRVATLEADNALLTEANKNAGTVAHQTATNNVKNAEKARKDAIKALVAKHNKDGDLNQIAVDALAGDTTAAEFQDKVMEVMGARAAKPAIKPEDEKNKDSAEADFTKKYEACKTFSERQALIRANREVAKRVLKS